MIIKLFIAVVLSIFSTIILADSHLEKRYGTKEILLDNTAVQVVRLTYPAGTQSGLHTHAFPHRVVYVVKGGKLTLAPEDKTKPSNTIVFKDGATLYLPATTHNVINVGQTDVVLIETEIK